MNDIYSSSVVKDFFLTDVEVAQMLRVSVGLVRKWRLKKTGPPFKKLGRLVRYDRSAVVAWKDRQ